MTGSDGQGRANQRRRTRKDLLDAAARLMAGGQAPSLEEVAQAALVSRATAYRYFPSVEALLWEASVHMTMPDPARLFSAAAPTDPAERVVMVDRAIDDQIFANETALRLMLAHAIERRAKAASDADVPARQNRRSPLIEAALEPSRKAFGPKRYEMLRQALALIIGAEGMIAIKDVLGLDEEAARRMKTWAIKALVEAAKKP